MEGQADWRAGNGEKSKPGVERSREMAERQGTADLVVAGAEEGLGISDGILSTRGVYNVTGEV